MSSRQIEIKNNYKSIRSMNAMVDRLKFPEFMRNIVVAERNLLKNWNCGRSHLEYWNNGMMGIKTGILE
jgi:hypothetical protein